MKDKKLIFKIIAYIICGVLFLAAVLSYMNVIYLTAPLRIWFSTAVVVLLVFMFFQEDGSIQTETVPDGERLYSGRRKQKRGRNEKSRKWYRKLLLNWGKIVFAIFVTASGPYFNWRHDEREAEKHDWEKQRFEWEQIEQQKEYKEYEEWKKKQSQKTNELKEEVCKKDSIKNKTHI
ncbi:MAG: hypothetical protein LBF85_04955 [Tannerella sp.]|jgi:hypothetical protein|nr:hypothetical protein [Tannerella sp.]